MADKMETVVRVRLIEHTFISGEPQDAGTVVDVPIMLGRALVGARKAEPVDAGTALGRPKPVERATGKADKTT